MMSQCFVVCFILKGFSLLKCLIIAYVALRVTIYTYEIARIDFNEHIFF